MRVSTRYQYERYQSDISRAQERYLNLQSQVATGKRVTTISDDPVAAAHLISLKGVKATTEQYVKNLDGAKGTLGFSEGALDESNKLLKRAYELAVSGANSTMSQEGRNAMAVEVRDIQQRLVALGNTRDGSGHYIFAGQSIDTKPFVSGTTGITFNGDTNPAFVEVGPGETMDPGTNLSAVLVPAYNNLTQLANDLEGGNLGNISGVDLAAMQNTMSAYNAARGVIGSKLQTIDRLKSDYARRIDDFATQISDVEDVDLSETLVAYQQAQGTYTAAMQIASQGFRLSLMDFIRG